MSESAPPIRGLLLGLDAEARAQLPDGGGSLVWEDRPCDLVALMEENWDHPPALILCSTTPDGPPVIEIAQTLRMIFPKHGIFYVTTQRAGFERKDYQKNGFSDAFLLPMDLADLRIAIQDAVSEASAGKIKSYRSVQLLDLAPGTELDFDTYLYLPANQKHIKYSAAGGELDSARLAKLTQHQVNSVQVTKDQIGKFYDFTARQLKAIGGSGGSETERREKLKSAVRNLISGIFNDTTSEASTAHGKAVVEDCRNIVKSYVLQSGSQNQWYSKLLASVGDRSSGYSHAANVSTFAALFSMGMGVGNPEDLALAGVLHDLGLAEVPMTIQDKSEEERTPGERKIYEAHVEHTMRIIRDRKLILPESVLKMVAQHHEHLDGTGYPEGLAGKKFSPEAQVLALADRFEELTAVREGKPRLTPTEALEAMRKQYLRTSAKIDPELIRKLADLFPQPTEEKAA